MNAETNQNLESTETTNNQLQIKELDSSYTILSPKEKLKKWVEQKDHSLIEQAFVEWISIYDLPRDLDIDIEVFGNTLNMDPNGFIINGKKISSILPDDMKSFVSHYSIYIPDEAHVIVANSGGDRVDLFDMNGTKKSIYEKGTNDRLYGYLKYVWSDEILIKNWRDYVYGNIDTDNQFTEVFKRSNASDMIVMGSDEKKFITIEKSDKSSVAVFINGELYYGLPKDMMSQDAKLEKITESVFRITFTDATGKNFAYEINLLNNRIKPGSQDKLTATVRSAHAKTLGILWKTKDENTTLEGELTNIRENVQTTQSELRNTQKQLETANEKNTRLQAQIDQLLQEVEEKRQAAIKINGENGREFTRLNWIIEAVTKTVKNESPTATWTFTKTVSWASLDVFIQKLQKNLGWE